MSDFLKFLMIQYLKLKVRQEQRKLDRVSKEIRYWSALNSRMRREIAILHLRQAERN
jgi:hypothetical protein